MNEPQEDPEKSIPIRQKNNCGATANCADYTITAPDTTLSQQNLNSACNSKVYSPKWWIIIGNPIPFCQMLVFSFSFEAKHSHVN